MKTNNSPLIYLIGCSVRNRSNQQEIVEEVKELSTETLLYGYIEKLARANKISNSEGGLISSVFGVKQWTDNIHYISLNKYFLRDGTIENFESLSEKLIKADGIIFSNPVYFGDRSSLFHEFIKTCRKRKIDFSGKVCGFISVGAKRNGGQETTNIYALHSFTELNALVVGNGPPTSQFGGTLVGGNMGTMENDYFGIMTSIGVGKKTAELASLIKRGSLFEQEKAIIDFWILEDENSQVEEYIKSIINQITSQNEDIEFKILNLTKYNFNRCFGCNICPNTNDKTVPYKCINKDDDMKKLHTRLLSSDAIVVCGLSLRDISKIKSVYQKFIERTRYIRRDHFKLTNRLVMAFSINEIGSNSLFNIRVLTSFIRHNVVFHKGFEEYIHNGNVIINREQEISDLFNSLIKYTKILKNLLVHGWGISRI